MSRPLLEQPADLAGGASALIRDGLEVDADGAGGTCVLRLRGELDMATAPRLRRALDAALDGRPPRLSLDLRELSFVDSTGIRVLLAAGRRAQDDGCALVLHSPCRSVLKALRLTCAEGLLPVEPAPSSL